MQEMPTVMHWFIALGMVGLVLVIVLLLALLVVGVVLALQKRSGPRHG